jgi:hypothetical protein
MHHCVPAFAPPEIQVDSDFWCKPGVNRIPKMRNTADLLSKINAAREEMIDEETDTPIYGCKGDVKKLQQELKSFLYPKLWFFAEELLEAHGGSIELGGLFPSCELHSYLQGLLVHQVEAIVHL